MPHPQQAEPSGFRYRPDIDGLRAIAVIPVVLYHFKVPPFTGGFVGVDVFFVISGFLITSLIDVEIRARKFSIVNFYERRVRRIMPPLIVLMTAAMVLSLILLFPYDLKRFAESVIAASAFVSNFEFWREAGYFDTGGSVKPLLHTWSLAVEEQFYLLFPPLLMLLGLLRRSYAIAIVWLFVLSSFAASVWGVVHLPTETFYLAPARLWELGIGSLLALGAIPVLRNRVACIALGILGVGLIAWGIFAFTPETPFPGPAALFPCMGTALVIYSGLAGPTPVGRVLAARPFVFVGLISYSFYLWHWPIYVFGRYDRFDELTPLQTALLIALSAALAVLSWRFVEQPIRKRAFLGSRKSLFIAAGLSMLGVVLLSVAILALHELPQRFSPDIRKILASEHDYEPRRRTCFDRPLGVVQKGDLCAIGKVRAGAPDFILWGDSHSDALLPAVEAQALRHNKWGLFAGRGACPPLFGVDAIAKRPRFCREFADAVQKIIVSRNIKTVIFATRWVIYAEGTRYGTEGGGNLFISDDQSPAGQSLADNEKVFQRDFPKTVQTELDEGRRVIIAGPVPEIGVHVPDTLAKMRLLGENRKIEPTRSEFLARQKIVLSVLADLARKPGVSVVYPQQILCGPDICMVQKNGAPLYVDTNHLSVTGAKLISPIFDPVF